MWIRGFSHKGLKRLYFEDDSRGLPAASVDKLRKILAFLQDMRDPKELHSIQAWRVHQLKGGRKGIWSVSVTRNWRVTFGVDTEEGEIFDLNHEDYH